MGYFLVKFSLVIFPFLFSLSTKQLQDKVLFLSNFPFTKVNQTQQKLAWQGKQE